MKPVALPTALLGLSANPPHAGHLAIGRALLGMGYGQVRYSIAPEQEFKPAATLAPYRHRVALANLLLAGQPGLTLDPTEATLAIQAEHDRTFELMRHLARQEPDTAFTFVMGADSWAHPHKGFHTWGKFAETLDYCGVLVIPRPNHTEPLADAPAALALPRFEGTGLVPRGQWALYPAPVADISSTALRAALAAGQRPNGLTPQQLAYIRQNRLYL